MDSNERKSLMAEKLRKHSTGKPSQWREKFEYLLTNEDWLRYSARIAMMMLDKMKETGMTQEELAGKMNCSQQYVSKILKGHENLSLETLVKIEHALGITMLF